MNTKRKIPVLLITLLITTSMVLSTCANTRAQTTYYLNVTTNPLEVLTADPSAVTGAGWYSSGSFGIVDAKQTIISAPYRYEFIGWESDDNDEYEEMTGETLTGNEAARFMDGDYIMVANYEVFIDVIQYTLTLETSHPIIITIDPNALLGAGIYNSGETATISAATTVIDWSTMTRYDFTGWTTALGEPTSLGNPDQVFMDADYTFIAEYDVSFYLDVTTDPLEVLTADPSAVTGAGWYSSGSFGIVDAKQTIISAPYRYEFIGWESDDNEYYEYVYGYPPAGNQGARFMDGSYTMVAIYEKSTIVEWEYVFKDDVRGTILRISTDDEYFQFSAPGSDYGVRKADSLIVFRGSLSLLHRDSDIELVAMAIPRVRVDFCLAYAEDIATGQSYLLRDKIGLE